MEESNNMNVIFMGTPEFAVPSLEMLIKKHNVLAVVTQPDRPKGRGKKMVFPIIKEIALEHNIDVLQPLSAKEPEFFDELKKYNADIFVVAAYGQILPEEVLNMPKFGSINVHGSILPEYRGASPMQMAVIDGKSKTGVTIMYMEKGLDTGDIISTKEVDVLPNDTYGTLGTKLANEGAVLLESTLSDIESGKAKREKQDDSKATYTHLIDRSMAHINWNKSAFEVSCLIRGLCPQMGAYTLFNGETLKIWKAESSEKEYNGENGMICDINKKGFVVKCAKGSILVLSVQAKGGKIMDTGAYMRGHTVEIGTILE